MNNADNIKIFLPEGLHFKCQGCGTCCGHCWNFSVDPDTYFSLQKTTFWDEIKKKHPQSRIMWYDPDRGAAFLDKVDGNCIMLESNLCIIHRELGSQAKPHGCRSFPFILTITPDGVYAGVSQVCPSIMDNVGTPVENYLPLLRKLLKKMRTDNPTGEKVVIGGNLTTNWEGYKIIEQFINKRLEESDILTGTFEALTAVAALVVHKGNGEPIMESQEKMEKFFNNPVPAPITRDEEFTRYQMQIAATMISMLESRDPSIARTNNAIILSGGVLDSETYNKMINVKPLVHYINFNPPATENRTFVNYIKHLVWRKYLLSTETIISGLSVLNMLPLMYCWYVFASAAANGREKPGEEDFKAAVGEIDAHIHHGKYLDQYFKMFSDDFMRQIALFVEQDSAPQD